jgi:coenzyme F420 hydrogenase subunit beta
MKPNVISTVVKNDLCIGCGVCATICPDQILNMRFNHFGEYNPDGENGCANVCGLCLKVCPFADGNDNEDSIGLRFYKDTPAIRYTQETGYYLESYAGFAPDTRERGSSGGMASWFLSTILKKGIVDYVIAVVPNDDPDQLFKYAILTDSQSVLDSSGSVYYPVELSRVLKEIQDKSGTCAIIGLPCFIKAIRLAQQRNKKLRERIMITAGLVCGQLKSKHYTDYISALTGVGTPLQRVQYRVKNSEKTASIFYFSCINKEGNTGKIFWNEGVSEAWHNRWFTPNACNYCDDIFAECADVTFMDAWLPEYSKDYRGTSLVLVRSDQTQNIIIDGIKSEEINLQIIPVQKIIKSQPAGIEEKRVNLAYRLYLNTCAESASPQKRIKPKEITNPFLKRKLVLRNQMQLSSRTFWAEQTGHTISEVKKFRNHMNCYLAQLSKWNRITSTCEMPLQCICKMGSEIRRYLHG